MKDSTRIAGNKTVGDWKDIRNQIRNNPNSLDLWNKAFDFFQARLETRYFKPIRDIKNNDAYNGEGFAIVTILCSLIEFLETTWNGEVYRYHKDKKQLRQHEYRESKQKFLSFLVTKPPFNKVFKSENLAFDFYKNVRCGLLHEASTKGDWTIRADNETEFYELRDGEKVIDREIFEERIREYLEFYKKQLLNQGNLKKAFIRKMNNIADLDIYF